MLCLRDSTGLRETEILLLEGTKSLVCTGTYGKRSDCIRGWAKISNLLVLEGLEQRRGQLGIRNLQVERLTAQFSSVMSDSL